MDTALGRMARNDRRVPGNHCPVRFGQYPATCETAHLHGLGRRKMNPRVLLVDDKDHGRAVSSSKVTAATGRRMRPRKEMCQPSIPGDATGVRDWHGCSILRHTGESPALSSMRPSSIHNDDGAHQHVGEQSPQQGPQALPEPVGKRAYLCRAPGVSDPGDNRSRTTKGSA